MLLKTASFTIVAILVLTDFSSSQSSYNKDYVKENVRSPRALDLQKWGFFETIGNMGRIIVEQYDDTRNTFQRLLDLLTDQFSDTATPPSVVPSTTPGNPNVTTTEKYRISRKEIGRILGRNYRGLQKLFRIEVNDALNQSKYSIAEYQQEYKNMVVPVGKTPPTTTTTTTTSTTTTTTTTESSTAPDDEDNEIEDTSTTSGPTTTTENDSDS